MHFNDLQYQDLAWLVLFLPLLATATITFFARRDGKRSAQLSIAAVVGSFAISLALLFLLQEKLQTRNGAVAQSIDWLTIGHLNIKLGLVLDRLSLVMLLIVTGVGSAIHLYSYGYMRNDPGLPRYFAGLSLFTFSMIGIVLADNFVEMFIFWELVGLSSYLLIGFWYDRPGAADACKKAFITNRLGDFGFVLGIILIWGALGTVHFDEIKVYLFKDPGAFGAMASLVGLLVFCGAMGKSAQFPLHVWLPDAMEGPTPVSALIHAATMVAAGVYMLCRVFFLYSATPAWPQALSWMGSITALDIIGWTGGFTALLAALIAVQQNDIKRILAYSTLSQLGYMIMAVGLSAPSPAMYHLSTHAFFKALLFLGAGSVIHVLHHEQNIWKMGSLARKMPVTFWTFLLAALALCGLPPLSGFFSKDEILAAASHHSVALFVLGTLVAMLTTFYMFRLVFVAFTGPAKSDAVADAHEAPKVMTWPLIILAVPTMLAGLWGINSFLSQHFHPGEAAPSGHWWQEIFAPLEHAPLAAIAGLGAVVFGLSFAYALYGAAARDPLPGMLGGLSRAMRNRFYFDEIYQKLIGLTHEALAKVADWIDRRMIAGLGVRGVSGATDIFGHTLRLLQTGNLQTYAFLSVIGIVLVLYLFLRT